MNGPDTAPDSRDPEPPAEGSPPLGSWPRLYVLVVIVAVAVMACLYWFTEAYHVPMGSR